MYDIISCHNCNSSERVRACGSKVTEINQDSFRSLSIHNYCGCNDLTGSHPEWYQCFCGFCCTSYIIFLNRSDWCRCSRWFNNNFCCVSSSTSTSLWTVWERSKACCPPLCCSLSLPENATIMGFLQESCCYCFKSRQTLVHDISLCKSLCMFRYLENSWILQAWFCFSIFSRKLNKNVTWNLVLLNQWVYCWEVFGVHRVTHPYLQMPDLKFFKYSLPFSLLTFHILHSCPSFE